ncbi:MAG: protein-L-isoaspartate(D-aspartate) O-methyltransferase [Rhodocyclaceae bacterium]|nr:protein-L-isoaspartate(D-aspartate) O-methyltransferase [Rhodocyclaceae bacterium]
MLEEIRAEFATTYRQTGCKRPSRRVELAMLRIPRDEFVPDSLKPHAYANGPLPIGHGQTISQPYIVALMTELLRPRAFHTVLEVGTGSGYQAAILACLVRRVISLEIVGALAEAARARLARLGIANVDVRHADGRLGWPQEAPYDGIIITAATPSIPPALIDQLKTGGRLVAPIGHIHDIQMLTVLIKHADGATTSNGVLPVAFVPLTEQIR